MAGRPPKYVNDWNGNVVVGLSVLQLKGRSRYYATHSKPRKWFGEERDHAIRSFCEWKGIPIPTPEPPRPPRPPPPKYRVGGGRLADEPVDDDPPPWLKD